MRLKRPVPTPDLRTGYTGAPIGGINTVDVATRMPPGDAIYCYNMIPAEYGLRARLGYREWVAGITDGGFLEVRTIIPFTGNAANGGGDRLFYATQAGIGDASASTGAPAASLIAFGIQSGSAAYGISTNFRTPAGRFCAYTDEENGLYYYSEASGLWAKAVLGTTVLWTLSTPYLLGDKVVNGANIYVCTAPGTSAGSGGPTGVGTGIADGTVTWDYVSAKVANAIGPSLADQRAGFSGDPAQWASVCVFGSRLIFVEKFSTRGWYLDLNAVYGTATSFDFGSKMKAGGPLSSLFNWSYDGGSGMQTLLVGLSTAGDVVIFGGGDIASLDFGIQGCWSLGGVPYGRRIATDNGGDILVMSTVGIVPLSKLVTGKQVVGESDNSKSVYATGKISNLFNTLVTGAATLPGWAMHIHPTDNTLLVLVPTQAGQPTQQLAMSFATKAWGFYRDMPMLSAGVWNGQLYFGTADGRVCINNGYVDNVLLADSSYSPIAWSILTAYDNLGVPNFKQVQILIPEMISEGAIPSVEAQALYDLNLTEPAPPSATGLTGDGTWDAATWDTSVWGGDYSASTPVQGSLGRGRSVAIAARGSVVARTVLVGFHVMYRQGGPL